MVVSRVTCRWLQGGLERADFDYMVIWGYEMSTTCRLHACDLFCRSLSSYTGCSPDNAYTQSCLSFRKGWSLTGHQSYKSFPPDSHNRLRNPPNNLWSTSMDRQGRPSPHGPTICTRVIFFLKWWQQPFCLVWHFAQCNIFETLCHNFNDFFKSKSRKIELI
jgi:hypothetical protein